MTKKLSKELNDAIHALYDNPEIGYNAIGCSGLDVSLKNLGLRQQRDLDISIAPLKRIALLRRKLENWVELKGMEIEEFEGEIETTRIQYEAMSTLMVLRSLSQYFPEVETASREEFDEHEDKL